jgi:hypothetical protein
MMDSSHSVSMAETRLMMQEGQDSDEFTIGKRRVIVSCYDLSRLLFDLKMKEAVYHRSLEDIEAVMNEYSLTTEEKAALRSGDPRKLRQLGVHGMLCLYIKRLNPEFQNNIYWAQK